MVVNLGTYTSPDGKPVDVTIEIHVDKLGLDITKAYESKGRKRQALGGAIVIHATPKVTP